jgi:hypothetical protein
MAELGLQRSEAALHDIAEMARQADANLYLVLYPWPHQIMFDGDEKNELDRWAERVAKSTGSLLINGLAAFREERRHRGATEMIRSYYIQADTHFSSMGHERVATLLANSLNPSSIRAPAR